MLCRLSHESFFVRQNTWIKLSILILGSIAALAIPVRALYFFSLVTLVYFLISPSAYACLLKGIRMLLPFMAFYALTATVFGESIDKVGILLLRISLMVSLVTYFSASFYVSRFLEDSGPFKKNSWHRDIVFYAIATLSYIKRFMHYYETAQQDNLRQQTLTSRITDAIFVNWRQREEIERWTESALNINYQDPDFLTKYNLWACIYLTLLILILAL